MLKTIDELIDIQEKMISQMETAYKECTGEHVGKIIEEGAKHDIECLRLTLVILQHEKKLRTK